MKVLCFFDGRFEKCAHHPHTVPFLSQRNSRWLPQLNWHRTAYKSRHFTRIELKHFAVVADTHPQPILWALTHVSRLSNRKKKLVLQNSNQLLQTSCFTFLFQKTFFFFQNLSQVSLNPVGGHNGLMKYCGSNIVIFKKIKDSALHSSTEKGCSTLKKGQKGLQSGSV